MIVALLVLAELYHIVSGVDEIPTHYKLHDQLMNNYKRQLIPRRDSRSPITVWFSIELYQIIEVNEPTQQLALNTWVVERWKDRLLGWKPEYFDNITELSVQADSIWVPDTMLYNTLVMEDSDPRRLLNAKITADQGMGYVELLYPTIYRFSCNLDLRFFPFDVQHCKLIIGSWTYDNTNIDYEIYKNYNAMGTSNINENGEWTVLGTKAFRLEKKFACCANNYTLLEFHLYLRRKPLYWIVNLIAPTSLITIISIIGGLNLEKNLFSTSSINDIREEKITLGITTLLSMSILIFMVSDKMPSTSSFVPLIGWFYSCMIMLISFGTLAAQVVIYLQKKSIHGKPPLARTMNFARKWGSFVGLHLPPAMQRAYELKDEVLCWGKILVPAGGTPAESRDTPDAVQIASVQCVHRRSDALRKSHCVLVPSPTAERSRNGTTDVVQVSAFDLPAPPRRSFASIRRSSSAVFDPQQLMAPLQQLGIGNSLRVPSPLLSSSGRKPSDSFNPFYAPPASTRSIAEYEYDWLAAVIESFLFFFMCLGINAIGLYFWHVATID